MSILDLILGHQIILILIGSALAMLLAALLIMLKNHLQTLSTQHAEHRAERAHALALAIKAEVEREAEAEKVMLAVAAKAAVKTPLPTPVPTPAAAVGATDAPATPEAQAATETMSGAMQDILSSVFADEESASHPEALLDGLKDIETTDLLILANRLAAQLGSATIKGKEL